MAQLNFPDTPIDGQLYPNPCPVGVTQYKWDSSTGIWRIVGVATGVVPGRYGDEYTVGQFTVDVAGRINEAANVAIARASLTNPGLVMLTNSTTSISETMALSAKGAKSLQDQIGNLDVCIVPDHTNVVAALNDLQQQSIDLQTNALIWCGYYNANDGDISYVSLSGQRLGYQIGQELPVAGPKNAGDFFIVTVPGNPFIAGDFNAPDTYIENGNWIVSEQARWSEVTARGPITASEVIYVPNAPLTANNVQNALYQVTQLFRTGIGGCTVSPTPPLNPYPGQLWWDSDDGLFYTFYVDPNSQQWVEVGGGGSSALGGGGGGTVYEVRTGVGLLGGPITTEGEIYLQPAFIDSRDFSLSHIGGVMPNLGFDYNNTTGELNLSISSDFTAKDPETAFSQEGANILNSKIDSLQAGSTLAGTYDAQNGVLLYVTPVAAAKGFVAGQNLPTPSFAINNYYVIVTVAGTQGPDGDGEPSASGDWYFCQGETSPPKWILIDFEANALLASNVAVTPPIEGIEFASNVQRALEAVELQVQDRIEFAEATSDGLQIQVSSPASSDYDGSTLSIGLDYASVQDRGIVQLTNDYLGNSQTLAFTQYGASLLNAKIEALAGANVLAGTYNANTGTMVVVTPAGANAGFIEGQNAPAAASVPDNYYIIVTVPGGYGPVGATVPPAGVTPGDWFIVENTPGASAAWICIDYQQVAVAAENVSLAPVPNLSATNVQAGISQLQAEVTQAIIDISSTNDGLTVQTTQIPSSFGYQTALTLNPATSKDLGGVFVAPNNGLNLSPAGGLSVAAATTTTIGGIIVGDNLSIDENGRLNSRSMGDQLYIELLDDISDQFNGVETTFTLQVGGNNLPKNTTIQMLFLSVGGIMQSALKSFIWDPLTSQVTFTGPPQTGTDFDGRVILVVPIPREG